MSLRRSNARSVFLGISQWAQKHLLDTVRSARRIDLDKPTPLMAVSPEIASTSNRLRILLLNDRDKAAALALFCRGTPGPILGQTPSAEPPLRHIVQALYHHVSRSCAKCLYLLHAAAWKSQMYQLLGVLDRHTKHSPEGG